MDKKLADKTIIGTNSVCKYIFLKAFNGSSSLAEHWNDAVNQLVDIEETLLVPVIAKNTTGVSSYFVVDFIGRYLSSCYCYFILLFYCYFICRSLY